MNNICEGIKEREKCDYNFQCSIGLACINAICIPQRKENEDCLFEQNCENNLGCSPFGKCIPYLSLHIGDYSNNSKLCETITIDKNGYCAESSLKQESRECLDEQIVCEYEINNGHEVYTKSEMCQCSRGHTDKKYCPLYSKSEEIKEYIKLFRDVLWKNRKAHTTRRFRVNYEEERKKIFIKSYPKYIDADDCSIEIDMDNHKDNLFNVLQ